MSFIGIITDKKTEAEFENILKEKIENYNLKLTVVVINEKSIENIKNIKFETIVVNNCTIRKTNLVKQILQITKYLIVNADLDKNLKLIESLETTVITYGFNSKSTITASSVDEIEMLICIQRNIKDMNNKIIEIQEFNVGHETQNKYIEMGISSTLILYGKISSS